MFVLVGVTTLQAGQSEAKHGSDDVPYGFAMFSMGLQATQYKQKLKDSAGNSYDSSTIASSPYLLTGSLTHINARHAFSIFATSTLFVSPSSEQYTRNGAAFDTHQAKLSLNTLDFTGYFSVGARSSLSYGVQYSYEVLQRYGFNHPALVERNATIVEVKTATFTPHMGYLYSSDSKAGAAKWRYLGAIDVGLPLVYISSNSYELHKSLIANASGNYSLGFRGYGGYRIIAGLEIGFHASMLYLRRSDNINYSVEGTTASVLQETQLQRYQIGVALNWNYVAFEALR